LAPPTTTDRSCNDGRQQPGVELAADAHRRADDPGRLGLELRAELIPVDEIRPDERGH
jgi:hypothetical protein